MENPEIKKSVTGQKEIIDFRSFIVSETKEVITVRVIYNSMINVRMKRVTSFNGKLSNLLTNYFNYPENKKQLEDILNFEELDFKIIDITGN